MRNLILAVLLAFAGGTQAIEPAWYSPLDGSGQGIVVRCNAQDDCVALWATYRNRQLQDRLPRAAELITVVETSTTVQESVDAEPVLQALQDLREVIVSEQVWMNSNELCPLDATECATSMSRFTGSWMGRFGDREPIEPPEVNVILRQNEDGIEVEYEAIRLLPEFCDTSTGGLIFRDCIGDKQFDFLAR